MATTDPVFPGAPSAPVYVELALVDRKAALKIQVKQFEAEMAGHFSNYARLKALFDEPGTAQIDRENAAAAAQQAVNAINTIKSAIKTTRAELQAL